MNDRVITRLVAEMLPVPGSATPLHCRGIFIEDTEAARDLARKENASGGTITPVNSWTVAYVLDSSALCTAAAAVQPHAARNQPHHPHAIARPAAVVVHPQRCRLHQNGLVVSGLEEPCWLATSDGRASARAHVRTRARRPQGRRNRHLPRLALTTPQVPWREARVVAPAPALAPPTAGGADGEAPASAPAPVPAAAAGSAAAPAPAAGDAGSGGPDFLDGISLDDLGHTSVLGRWAWAAAWAAACSVAAWAAAICSRPLDVRHLQCQFKLPVHRQWHQVREVIMTALQSE